MQEDILRYNPSVRRGNCKHQYIYKDENGSIRDIQDLSEEQKEEKCREINERVNVYKENRDERDFSSIRMSIIRQLLELAGYFFLRRQYYKNPVSHHSCYKHPDGKLVTYEEFIDAYSDRCSLSKFPRVIDRYDTEKGRKDFVSYFLYGLPDVISENYQQECRKRKAELPVMLNQSDDGSETESLSEQGDEGKAAEEMDENARIHYFWNALITYQVNLKNKILNEEHSKNETKRYRRFRTFHTGEVIDHLKVDNLDSFIESHPREVWNSLFQEFNVFVYRVRPKDLYEMVENPLKTYADVFKKAPVTKADMELAVPLEQGVYAGFLNIKTSQIKGYLDEYHQSLEEMKEFLW